MTNLDGYMAKREAEKRQEEVNENQYHDTASVPVYNTVFSLLGKEELTPDERALLSFLL